MSRTDRWMPLYIGDYLADTMHLDAREHGAYLLLIMHYWRTGPLPDDDRKLAGIARVERRVWVNEVGPAVRPFFSPENGALHHGRIDKELEKASELSTKRRDAANRRHEKDKGKKVQTDGGEPPNGTQEPNKTDANVVQLHDACNANALQKEPHARTCASASPSPSPRKKEKEEEESRSLRSLARNQAAEGFEMWWERYPRKVGKDAARKAYTSAVKRGATDAALLAALDMQRWSPDPQFIPHASTWLNGGRWLDDPDAAAPPKPYQNGFMELERLMGLHGDCPTIDHDEEDVPHARTH